MGADIWSYTEQCHPDSTWRYVEWSPGPDPDERDSAVRPGPFDLRNYAKFGFLAGVRNHDVPPLVPPRGLPEDVSDQVRAWWERDIRFHTPSWLTVTELTAVDYYQQVQANGETQPLREFLDVEYFADLKRLQELDLVLPTRVVFWFDS